MGTSSSELVPVQTNPVAVNAPANNLTAGLTLSPPNSNALPPNLNALHPSNLHAAVPVALNYPTTFHLRRPLRPDPIPDLRSHSNPNSSLYNPNNPPNASANAVNIFNGTVKVPALRAAKHSPMDQNSRTVVRNLQCDFPLPRRCDTRTFRSAFHTNLFIVRMQPILGLLRQSNLIVSDRTGRTR